MAGYVSHMPLSAAVCHSLVKSITFDLLSHKISLLISVGKLYHLGMKHQKINVSYIFLFLIRFKMYVRQHEFERITGSFFIMLAKPQATSLNL